ncbi:carboxylating nicotinate-nucleotide diphosphorylase [Prochlorococcus sp. MIT 1223]|uniref:carboxylating nicotinate-nucleotide diphosphorylase n=1 Tax=Prochlorococcus sp. MIT 1223 TaxID=3096217 RepID=UPI002A74B20A|nr:carboxylating nicotinate-nucleotide diphosphorylase [Prochlorococcus sp. MIT 1223]
MNLLTPSLNKLLDLWIDEDIGRGDLTRLSVDNQIVSAYWVAKEEGVFCGGTLVEQLFHKFDSAIQVNLKVQDGCKFKVNEHILSLKGSAAALLAAERTSLNLAMHLSGISTATALLVEQLKGTNVRLADTRKTTPGLRVLEKYAVRCGGGINHRMGLDDAAMLKENHLAWTNGIETTIQTVRKSCPWTSKIIVEAETTEQALQAVEGGADGVLLDEMSPELILTLVPRLRHLAKVKNPNRSSNQIIIEVSGINPKELKTYANTGIDLISTSAPITRSAWIDLSMRFEEHHNQK